MKLHIYHLGTTVHALAAGVVGGRSFRRIVYLGALRPAVFVCQRDIAIETKTYPRQRAL